MWIAKRGHPRSGQLRPVVFAGELRTSPREASVTMAQVQTPTYLDAAPPVSDYQSQRSACKKAITMSRSRTMLTGAPLTDDGRHKTSASQERVSSHAAHTEPTGHFKIPANGSSALVGIFLIWATPKPASKHPDVFVISVQHELPCRRFCHRDTNADGHELPQNPQLPVFLSRSCPKKPTTAMHDVVNITLSVFQLRSVAIPSQRI